MPESGLLIGDVLRTPFGRREGALKFAKREALVSAVRRALIERNGLVEGQVPVCGIEALEEALQAEQPRIVCGASGCEEAASAELWVEAADVVAARWRIPREMADIFAAESHEKAVLAQRHGLLADEILTVAGDQGPLEGDELPRADVSTESLSALQPARTGGRNTVGNVSPVTIGAAALLLSGERFAQEHGLGGAVRLSAVASVEDDPELAGTGMIAAAERVIERAGVRRQDVGLWEIQELSAAHSLAAISELDLPFDRVNAWGGAIARGNPPAAAALQLIGTLTRQMERYKVELGVAAFVVNRRGMAAILRLNATT